MSARAATWRTQQLVAKYGKALRFPVCRAALCVWQTRDLIDQTLTPLVQVIKAEEQNRQLVLLCSRLREAGKSKETRQARVLLRRSTDSLCVARRLLKRNFKAIGAMREMLGGAQARFARESVAALRANDFAAFEALPRAWKAWKSPGKSPDNRKLVILTALRARSLDRARRKGKGRERYLEAAFGAERALNDPAWPKLSVRDLREYLVAAKAFVRDENQSKGQLRQVRHLAKELGITLQEGKRTGRPKGSRNWRIAR
jgi:hypothetical protein